MTSCGVSQLENENVLLSLVKVKSVLVVERATITSCDGAEVSLTAIVPVLPSSTVRELTISTPASSLSMTSTSTATFSISYSGVVRFDRRSILRSDLELALCVICE